MIDKLIYKFFGYIDKLGETVDKVFIMDFSHCEKPDCPKKKKKETKNNKFFKG